MIKIRLFCAAGMSTGILVERMIKSARERGLEADIAAAPVAAMEEETKGIDVAFLGPQVRYKLDEAKKICGEKKIPVEVIPMADYGTMNGKNVLDFALRLSGREEQQ